MQVKGRYCSFGLGQIWTCKEKGKLSTFDLICMKFARYPFVYSRQLTRQDVRDVEVLKAINGKVDSVLYDIETNVYLCAAYLKWIKERCEVEVEEDVGKYAFYYNKGLNADEKDYKYWICEEDYHRKFMETYNYLLEKEGRK